MKDRHCHVYNWGEYTGENLLNDFEAKTGATVVMENFDSNEQMYIKVANGETYDVLDAERLYDSAPDRGGLSAEVG